MLEKLAGRLTWEQTGQGIRVEIPAQCDWFVVIGGLILAAMALFSTSLGAMSLIFENPNSTRWLGTLGMLVLECLALSVLAWNFKGKTTLLLDPSEMKIDCRLEICDFPKERALEYIGIRQ